MEEKLGARVRDNFHSINNLLNKITTHAGITRHHLGESGINPEKIEEEKAKLIKVMDSMEENALEIGELLKKLRKNIDVKESGK